MPVLERYKNTSEEKRNGVVYTPELLADFLASKIVDYYNVEKQEINILDPAIGDGALIVALIKKIREQYSKDIKIKVCGFDINQISLNRALMVLSAHLPVEQISLKNVDFLDYLSESINCQKGEYDLIIANPPYIRTQLITEQKLKQMNNLFDFGGRLDSYHVFLAGIGKLLSKDGIAGVITSNSFMTTKTGAPLRKFLLKNYDIKEIYDLGDTKLFKAAVLPSIVIFGQNNKIKSSKIKFASIYETQMQHNLHVKNIFEHLHSSTIIKAHSKNYKISVGVLPADNDSVWVVQDEEANKFNETLKPNIWKNFEDISKIKVGVKTCADKIFIKDSKCTEDNKIELLYPLITHHSIERYKITDHSELKNIIYPHISQDNKTVPVQIENFPYLHQYLLSHKEQLLSRKYLLDANRKWFELWVPHNPFLWSKNKIVFVDITDKPCFCYDNTGKIVNGDCYWLILNQNENEDLLFLLLAIANSTFIEKFYDTNFQNKLYAGRRRFITQYVNKFPIPDPNSEISQEIISIVKPICNTNTKITPHIEKHIDNLVWKSFGFKDAFG